MSSYPPPPVPDGIHRADFTTNPSRTRGDGSAYDRFAPLPDGRLDIDHLALDEKFALLDALTADIAETVHDNRLGELASDDVLIANRVLDRCMRRVRSAQLETVSVIGDKGLYVEDGFRTPKALLVHSLRLSPAAAARLVKTAKGLKAMPCARSAYARGDIGSCQVDQMGRLYGNPRIKDEVEECDELFTEDAAQVGFEDFAALLKQFEQLADQDGAEKKDDRNHQDRNASLTQDFDGGWTLTGSFASAQGAALKEIFDRFIESEFQADLAAAREERGEEDVQDRHLDRSAAQRRADALYALFVQSAATPPGHTLPVPLVNIVFNETDLEDAATRRTTGEATAEPARYRESRCSTDYGANIDPRSALSAALIGHIRRVVLNGKSVVTDLGRKQRLFTGSARDAALLNELRCNYANCGVSARLCQIDHLLPWSHGGPSDQDNAGPKCRFHNQWATRGFRTWRDNQGRWHTYRPDGTEIL